MRQSGEGNNASHRCRAPKNVAAMCQWTCRSVPGFPSLHRVVHCRWWQVYTISQRSFIKIVGVGAIHGHFSLCRFFLYNFTPFCTVLSYPYINIQLILRHKTNLIWEYCTYDTLLSSRPTAPSRYIHHWDPFYIWAGRLRHGFGKIYDLKFKKQ